MNFRLFRRSRLRRWPVVVVALVLACPTAPVLAAELGERDIALNLAGMLRAARAVIADNQDRINDASLDDKGLGADVVLARAIDQFKEASGTDPGSVDKASRFGRLLDAQLRAIRNVMDEHQETINRKGIGFKGFVPAVFARLVNERFDDLVGNEARIKVTAPVELVRNRKARPDRWESEMIGTRLQSADWQRGKVLDADGNVDGRPAYRVLVPEYYSEGCLACHGEPKGELDVTGYPKEGGRLGALGGVISVTLFR